MEKINDIKICKVCGGCGVDWSDCKAYVGNCKACDAYKGCLENEKCEACNSTGYEPIYSYDEIAVKCGYGLALKGKEHYYIYKKYLYGNTLNIRPLRHKIGDTIEVACCICQGSGLYLPDLASKKIRRTETFKPKDCYVCNGIGKVTLKVTDIQIDGNIVNYTWEVNS